MTVDEALEFCKAGAIIDVNEQNLVVVSDAVTTLRDEVLRLRKELEKLSTAIRKHEITKIEAEYCACGEEKADGKCQLEAE